MSRTFVDARRWQREGTTLLLATVGKLSAAEFDEPSGLPGWSRRYLVAHLAANADALKNLAYWAASGEKTPMYASPDARIEGIERGSQLPVDELAAWLRSSAENLEADMAALTAEQWETEVVTAQGRTVPATETPWMRGREVFVHAVDLANGVTFTDLPADFLEALNVDIVNKRREVPDVVGALADATAYYAGRPYDNVTLTDGSPPPELGPWL